ncbi:MAG: T9SS type A sorting domain-containing protein [Chitinophagales bacterium]
MKNLLIKSIVVFSCYFMIVNPLSNLYSQSFAPVGAEWTFIGGGGFFPPCDYSDKLTYVINMSGQISIDGKSVNVLSRGNSKLYLNVDSNKIHFYEDSAFHLYMDMNLTVGDTLHQEYPKNLKDFHTDCACDIDYSAEVMGVVTKDTMVEIDGQLLKRLYFDFYDRDTIMNSSWSVSDKSHFTEIIGSAHEILDFHSHGDCILADCCPDILLCYQDNMISYDYSFSNGCVYTSISEFQKFKFKTYPNPVHTIWYIQSDCFGILELYSLSGMKILSKQIQTGTEQINVSQFAEGIYFYRISSENEEVMKSGKLVKQ